MIVPWYITLLLQGEYICLYIKEDPARPIQGRRKWLTWLCSNICYRMSSQQIIQSKSPKLIGLNDLLLGFGVQWLIMHRRATGRPVRSGYRHLVAQNEVIHNPKSPFNFASRLEPYAKPPLDRLKREVFLYGTVPVHSTIVGTVNWTWLIQQICLCYNVLVRNCV